MSAKLASAGLGLARLAGPLQAVLALRWREPDRLLIAAVSLAYLLAGWLGERLEGLPGDG